MLNCFTVQGRLVRNVELKATPNGTSVANFCIANEIKFPKSTSFFNCVAWRQTAEFAEKWFKKGDLVIVEGSVYIKEWTDRNGVKRHEPEIQVRDLNFCGKSESNPSPEVAFQPMDDDEDILPF